VAVFTTCYTLPHFSALYRILSQNIQLFIFQKLIYEVDIAMDCITHDIKVLWSEWWSEYCLPSRAEFYNWRTFDILVTMVVSIFKMAFYVHSYGV
jgi:hypothetical protein